MTQMITNSYMLTVTLPGYADPNNIITNVCCFFKHHQLHYYYITWNYRTYLLVAVTHFCLYTEIYTSIRRNTRGRESTRRRPQTPRRPRARVCYACAKADAALGRTAAPLAWASAWMLYHIIVWLLYYTNPFPLIINPPPPPPLKMTFVGGSVYEGG